MLIWYLSINDYVGKFPEHVLLFSNPGDKILFLLKFNETSL